MADAIEVRITIGGVEFVRINQPLNPDATVVGGLTVKLVGWAIDNFGGIPANTEFDWEPRAPVILPKKEKS